MRGGPRRFTPGFTSPALLGKNVRRASSFRLQDCHLLRLLFPEDSTKKGLCDSSTDRHLGPTSPTTPVPQRVPAYMKPVWARSVSLAATQEVEVSFLSWGYLDVSVHPVRLLALCVQTSMTRLQRAGFPHSDISGSQLAWQLPEASRSHATSFVASWPQNIHRAPFVA